MAVFLFAMAGNGQIAGIDLVLVVLGPVCLFLFALPNPAFDRRWIEAGLFVALISLVLLTLAFRYESLLGHVFWPIKAALLALFVSQTAPQVRPIQVHLLFLMVLVLFLTSSDQFGRSYGIFGPNMLYRFYGLLFLAALYMSVMREGPLIVWAGYIALALVGVIGTGSVGGILLIVVGASLFLKFNLKSALALLAAAFLLAIVWGVLEQTVAFRRLMGKAALDYFFFNSRVQGTIEILAVDWHIFGRPYDDFRHVWREGYEYPHNVFVELISFYGLLGGVVSAMLLAAFVVIWRRIRRRECGLFDLTFIAIFVGSLLSGDLSDNYGVVGLALSATLFGKRKRMSSA